ncbi:MAG: hypothetical protein FWC43_07680 [Planctomycetaceae bacterium]|nr:hypothetical protein [Planctomycetaceae bacterium]
MTRTELEEILSAYLDDELSPQNKKKVEALVETNAQAKSILEGYISVRKAIQRGANTLQHKVPAGFTASVLASIDAATPQSKVFESTRYKTLARWKNPRVFAWPLVILICALFVGVFYRPHTSDTTSSIAQNKQDYEKPTISPSVEEEPNIPAPLSGEAGSVSQPEISVQPEKTDIRFVCRVENATTDFKTLFNRVFAKHKVVSNCLTSEVGTVYEITVTPETLRKILEDFRANSVEIPDETENFGTEKPVKVFFQVEYTILKP